MPGVTALAEKLGLSPKTAAAALRQLEKERLVSHEGAGRRRRILLPESGRILPAMRVSILLGESEDAGLGYMVEILHQLSAAGFLAGFAPKTLSGLGMNPKRMTEFVEKNESDAWVLLGASQEVLKWFSARHIPTFAIFGSFRDLPVAGSGPDKIPALKDIIENLTRLGHSRIVLINRSPRRIPMPGAFELAFLNELGKRGIATSAYNMPDWQETADGLVRCLESLFKITPPTAFILDEATFFTAVMRFLFIRNLRVPEDVSIICNDDDPSFSWVHPPISRVSWDARLLVRDVMRWADHLNRGVRDVSQSLFQANFVPGATLGPAKDMILPLPPGRYRGISEPTG
jgi:DNA-binding LacI/PurR family transcriptional regulator